MPMLLAAGLAAALLHLTPGRAEADDGPAKMIGESSTWIMRGVPPALTLFGGKKEERIGRRMMDAGIAATLATEALKRVTRQPRPDDPTSESGFPSGHASAAWALAEAAGTEDPRLRPYTYTFATAVTWSRVKQKRHTALQAAAGAALGYAFARASASSDHGLCGGLFVKESDPVSASPLAPSWGSPSPSLEKPAITLWETHW